MSFACVTLATSVVTAAAVPRDARRAPVMRGTAATPPVVGTLHRRFEKPRVRLVRCAVSDDTANDFVPWTSPERLLLTAGWLGLGSTAVFVAPTGTTEFDTELITSLISSPFSGTVNPIFEALFNSLGVVPAVYAALLLPGGKDQPRLPPVPPIALSFALGFFALGPYLITREPRGEVGSVKKSDLGWATKTVFESKIFAVGNAAFATFLTAYAVSHADTASVQGFVELWTTQSALCCVSSCDLLVLSLAFGGVIAEDMERRGFSNIPAAAFAAVPVLGPCLWLVVRPTLEE